MVRSSSAPVVSAGLASALALVAGLPAGSRVAVLGSRGSVACPALLALARAFVAGLPAGVVVVSGGASGVDAAAAAAARARGLPVAVFAAAWSSLGAAAGPARSRALLSSGVSAALVFWSGSAASSPGSAGALVLCRSLGVPFVSVVCPAAAGSAVAVAAPSLWG